MCRERPVWPGPSSYDPRRKHDPPSQKDWDQSIVVASSGRKRGVAKFRPGLPISLGEICEHCIANGTFLPDNREHVAAFGIRMDVEVGASNGERTQYVYAEWGRDGSAHARPITQAELENKGYVG